MTTSDLIHVVEYSRALCTGELFSHSLTRNTLPFLSFWTDDVEADEALEMGTDRVQLPGLQDKAGAKTAYRGAMPHTYAADPAQLERIAGHGYGDAVSKLVLTRNGKSFGACVPRKPLVDLIVSAPGRLNSATPPSHRSTYIALAIFPVISIDPQVVGKTRDAPKSPEANGQRGTEQLEQAAWVIPSSDESGRHVYVRDNMAVDADIVYDRLEAGAHIHCCSSKGLAPLVRAMPQLLAPLATVQLLHSAPTQNCSPLLRAQCSPSVFPCLPCADESGVGGRGYLPAHEPSTEARRVGGKRPDPHRVHVPESVGEVGAGQHTGRRAAGVRHAHSLPCSNWISTRS